jgi:exosortase
VVTVTCRVADQPAPPAQPGFAALSGPARLSLGLLVLAAAVLSFLLWPQWRSNPDLSHGLFAPVVALILLSEARRGPFRYLRPGPVADAALAAGLGAAVLAVTAGGLYAAALGWSHAVVGFVLAAALGLLLFAGLLVFGRDDVRLVPWNWSAWLAAGLWLASAPIPPGTYTRLTLALQLWVSDNVLRALHLLGIAAAQHGNIIELARTSVGIEEACSGVRSLISCLYAALFFSGFLVRRPWARALLIALAAPLALGMNFARSLTLTLLANAGIDIAGPWHDFTGYAILGVTAVLLGGLGLWLARREPAPVAPPGAAGGAADLRPVWRLAGGLGVTAALLGLFVFFSVRVPREDHAAPDLEALLPSAFPGWQVETARDLHRFADTLRTDRFVQRTYVRIEPGRPPVDLTVYIAYWLPGQASVSEVATHTPDACWPGGGWVPVPVAQTRVRIAAANQELAAAEYRQFKSQVYLQNVWYWHLYDRRPIPYLDPLSPRNLLEIALRYGFRRAGDQMFVRISSSRRWDEITREPLLAEIAARLHPLGL